VLETDTLVIEPGVEAYFSTQTKLRVDGTLIAIGTQTDSIYFTAKDTTQKWLGIQTGGKIPVDLFKYCSISYASYAGIVGKIKSVIHTKFYKCQTGLLYNTSDNSTIDSCTFSKNHLGVYSGSEAVISNSFFISNNEAVSESASTLIGCSFIQNNKGVFNSRGTIDGCSFESNKTGIEVQYPSAIRNTEISNNEVGISFMSSFNSNTFALTNSRVCNNTLYNIKNDGTNNISIYNTCMCESDSASAEAKIYDGLDNGNAGLINFTLYNSSCDTIIKNIQKFEVPNQLISNNNVAYPNPSAGSITISETENVSTLIVSDLVGNILFEKNYYNEESISIDLGPLEMGIYLLKIIYSDGEVKDQKISISY
jgi:hypothetical protein